MCIRDSTKAGQFLCRFQHDAARRSVCGNAPAGWEAGANMRKHSKHFSSGEDQGVAVREKNTLRPGIQKDVYKRQVQMSTPSAIIRVALV